MEEDENSQTIPGYVSPQKAAEMLGISDETVYHYLQTGRLQYERMSRMYLIPIKAVEEFRRQPAGRVRKQPPLWRTYRSGIALEAMGVQVRIRTGQGEAFRDKLRELRERQEHRLTGTSQRYILVEKSDPALVHIWLVWKDNELPDEETRVREWVEFQAEFVEVLDWATARSSEMEGLLYT